MRFAFTTLLFLFVAHLFGQNTAFTTQEAAPGQSRQFVLSEKIYNSEILSEQFHKYQVFEAPLESIHQFAAAQQSNFNLTLQFGATETLELSLQPVSLWNSGATLQVATPDGLQSQPMPAATTYRGAETDHPGAQIACSFAQGFTSGCLMEGSRTVNWEPLFRYDPTAPHNLLIRYESADVIPPSGKTCGVSDKEKLEQNIAAAKPEESALSTGCYEIELAQAADYSMWQKYGSASAVVDYMAAVINQVQLNYDNEFTNGLKFRIVGTWLSSCSNCDPWTTSTDPGTLLSSFQTWGASINGFPGLTYDLGELWTNRDFDGSVVGLAYVGTVCTFTGFHEIQDWTTGDLLRCTVSHEIGHNMGASHDPSGSPTIMAPVANNSNTWSAQSLGEMNPVMQNAVNNGCFFPCSTFHLEYAKVGEEGFRNRDATEIIARTNFDECEPVWMYFSFNQIEAGTTVEGKTEMIFPGGTVFSNTFSQGPAPANGWLWLRYTQYYNSLQPGIYYWKLYQRVPSGDYVLLTTQTIFVNLAPAGLGCGEKLHLPLNSNLHDVSGQNHHATEINGPLAFDKDRFGNCNGSLRITNGGYLEAPVTNERAVSLWFKMNQQDQMVIYDSGPNGAESKNFNIGVYKPNGLWGNAAFDNTYGVFFATGDRDIAVPFDSVKTGWHHFVVSRVADGYERFRIMVDGKFRPGYFYDGSAGVQTWTAQNQPFTFPADGDGVPNLFVPTYKTYMGRDSQQVNELFDGWLDEVRVFNQLLSPTEMMTLYTAPDDNPNNIGSTAAQLFYCEGQSIQLNGAADNAISFSWTGPNNFSSSQQNPTIPNATTAMSGVYTMTVNITGGCVVTDTVHLNVNIRPVVTTTGMNECAGTANGSVTALASGGTGITYLWSNGHIDPTISGLSGGATFTVTVTNSGGCTATDSTMLLTIPSPSVTVTNTVSACLNQTNGSATVAASGGVLPYQYLWSNGQTTTTAVNLAVGAYTVTITSANGCTATATANVTEASTPAAGIASTTTTCGNAMNGSASVAAGGGVPPYQYAWSNGQTTLSIFNLAVGTYTVTVTGSNGCAVTAVATIQADPTPVATVTATTGTCSGDSGGSATVSVSGGLLPYQYIWTSGSFQPTATNLPVGTYTVTVYGGNGCSATATATVDIAPTPVPAISSFSNSCSGQSNGFATVTVTGGAAPLQYAWSNGQTTTTISNLAAGTYTVTVTGSNGCTGSATVFIGTSSAPFPTATATNTCAGQSGGSATVSAVGGTPPYVYTWSNGQSTATATNLASGTYTVTVSSNGGCSATATATVGTSSAPTASISAATGTCTGQSAGTATVTAGGGLAPYQYAWSNGQTVATATSLAVGTFTVTVTGNNGCTATATATISALSAPAASISATTNTCSGLSNGAATVTASGGVAPYQYAWSNGQTTPTAINLAVGAYTVTVTGSNGCTGTATATISAAGTPVATIAAATDACSGQSNGTATATASGGVAPYQYAWSNGQSTATAINLAAGTYTVTVTGSNGCSSTTTATIGAAGTPLAGIASSTDACAGQNNGAATVSVSGGVMPYQYAWNNGQTTATAVNLSAGTYTVTVTGNNGCSSTSSVTIGTASSPAATISKTEACSGSSNGTATVAVSGGATPYQYAWNNGQTTATAVNLGPGTYTVTVTGNNGCTTSATAVIGISTPLVLTLNTLDLPTGICQSTLTVGGGIPPFTFAWSNGETVNPAIGLPNGAFSVTVTDANSCTATVGGMCTAVGVSDVDGIEGLGIYPNPSSGMVVCALQLTRAKSVEITVLDVLGREVYRKRSFGDHLQETLDLSRQPAGMYFVEIRAGEAVRIMRLVIER